jgi:hypothetical protein
MALQDPIPLGRLAPGMDFLTSIQPSQCLRRVQVTTRNSGNLGADHAGVRIPPDVPISLGRLAPGSS